VNESSRLLSANMRLKGRDNPHLDWPPLLLLDPHVRQKDDLPRNPPRLSLYKGIGLSPPLQPKRPSGTSSRSRPVCNLAVSHRVLSLLLSFPALVFLLPLSRVWVASVRPAVVLFYNLALFVLRLICPLLCFMPDDGINRPHLYLIVSIHPSLWISSCLYVFLPSLPRCCVCSVLSSLALDPIVCPYYSSAFEPFRSVYIFYPSFLLCLYCPPWSLFSHNLVLSYLHPFMARSQNH